MILTQAVREQLITLAKSRAEAVANCVAASVPFSHLVSDLPREGLYALLAVLAEGSDRVRLHQVVTTAGVGDAPAEPVPARLREAHAEYVRLKRAGFAPEDMPARVRRDNWEYQRRLRQRLEAVA